jgi:hypothetical protein
MCKNTTKVTQIVHIFLKRSETTRNDIFDAISTQKRVNTTDVSTQVNNNKFGRQTFLQFISNKKGSAVGVTRTRPWPLKLICTRQQSDPPLSFLFATRSDLLLNEDPRARKFEPDAYPLSPQMI